MFKRTVIDRPKQFFADYDAKGNAVRSVDYEREVLSRHKSPLKASLPWLKEVSVATGSEIATGQEPESGYYLKRWLALHKNRT